MATDDTSEGGEWPAMIIISFLTLGVLINAVVSALLAVPTAVLVGVLMHQLTSRTTSLGKEKKEESNGTRTG